MQGLYQNKVTLSLNVFKGLATKHVTVKWTIEASDSGLRYSATES